MQLQTFRIDQILWLWTASKFRSPDRPCMHVP